MANPTLRFLSILLIGFGLFALGGCSGRNPIACAQASGGTTCGCGGMSNLCVAPRYVFADGLDGNVSVFPVDPSTFELGSPTSTAGSQMSLGMAVLNNQYLYITNSIAVEDAGSISGWSINGTTLTSIPGSPFTLGPLSIGVGLGAANYPVVLYVADAGRIDAFQADTTGAITPIAGSPFPSGTNLYLTVDPLNGFLFASDVTPPGGVDSFTIDPISGALTVVAGSPFPAVSGSAVNANPGQLMMDQGGRYLYVVLQDTDQIAAFSLVQPGGALTPVPGSPFPTGHVPFTIATTANSVYVSNLSDGTISAYSIGSGTGILTPVPGSPFAIPASSMTTAPGGGYLYVSGAGGMMTFRIDSTTGGLTQVGTTIPYAGATALVSAF